VGPAGKPKTWPVAKKKRRDGRKGKLKRKKGNPRKRRFLSSRMERIDINKREKGRQAGKEKIGGIVSKGNEKVVGQLESAGTKSNEHKKPKCRWGKRGLIHEKRGSKHEGKTGERENTSPGEARGGLMVKKEQPRK